MERIPDDKLNRNSNANLENCHKECICNMKLTPAIWA